MKTLKVRRPDGLRCFYCNAPAGEDSSRCSECDCDFTQPAQPESRTQKMERGKQAAGSRKLSSALQRQQKSHWLMLAVLAGSVVLLVALFAPRPVGPNPVVPMPEAPRPDYRVIETHSMPSGKLQRLTLIGLVEPGLHNDALRDALDWMVYSALDEHNRQNRKAVRVIWAYVLEDSLAAWSDWRAMAIWTDPKLPKDSRPARIGGDAVKDGPFEYDFTNPGANRIEDGQSSGRIEDGQSSGRGGTR